ncbi:MAG: hypothetical protein EAZ65_08030 [Verrucomicrobia bacterium]|nr:MAG: hypothetical protein EAZ82_09820 [Verrucomicrobiota bacterium]TAF40498.1 MAG: hypothetical protein EAZ65_08030 [Verrucomicrobiota bacterium]
MALSEDGGKEGAEGFAALFGIRHGREQLAGAQGVVGGDPADHADHPGIGSVAVVVVVCPLDGAFRVVASPGGKDGVAGERIAGVCLGVVEGLEWIALGPGAEKHRVLAHPRVGDPECPERSDDGLEIAGRDRIDELEPCAGALERIRGAHELLHPGEGGVSVAAIGLLAGWSLLAADRFATGCGGSAAFGDLCGKHVIAGLLRAAVAALGCA